MKLLSLIVIALCLGACSSGADEKQPKDSGNGTNDGDDGDDGDAVEVTMTWDAFSIEDTTFNVYARYDVQDTTLTGVGVDTLIASDLTVGDASSPKLTLVIEEYPDLESFVGHNTCIWLTATVDGIESDASTSSCVDL